MLMKLAVLMSVVLVLVGCTTPSSQVPADPSFASDIEPIFSQYCLSCHTAGNPEGSYALDSYAGALGGGTDTIPNVIPGNADSSLLYRRVAGIQLPQMPLGGAPLDTSRIATIRNWIDQGAKNN